MIQESAQRMMKRVKELKVQTKSMFKETSDIVQLMNLIDSVEILGLDYHFEDEIDEAIKLIYEVDDKSYGIYETSLRFRLLRQHGYHVSAGNDKNKLKLLDYIIHILLFVKWRESIKIKL